MIKYLRKLFFLFCLLFILSGVHAKKKDFTSLRFKTNFLQYSMGQRTAFIEYKFRNDYGIELKGSYIDKYHYNFFNFIKTYHLYKGYEGQIGFKNYFKEVARKTQKLAYVSVYFAYRNLNYVTEGVPTFARKELGYVSNRIDYHLKSLMGYEFVFKHKWIVEFYGGAGIKYTNFDQDVQAGYKVYEFGNTMTYDENKRERLYHPEPTFHIGVKFGYHKKLYK